MGDVWVGMGAVDEVPLGAALSAAAPAGLRGLVRVGLVRMASRAANVAATVG